MYYAIIKFVKEWSDAEVQQLLATWDRQVIFISDCILILLTAPREVFSSDRVDNKPGDDNPDPDSLAARLTRRVQAMINEGAAALRVYTIVGVGESI